MFFFQAEEEHEVNENSHPFENEAEVVEATLPSLQSTTNNNNIYTVECILDKKKQQQNLIPGTMEGIPSACMGLLMQEKQHCETMNTIKLTVY